MEHTYHLFNMIDLVKATFKNGGATFNTRTLKLETPEDGFWVGGLKPTVTIPDHEFTLWTLREAVEAMGDVAYVGTWRSNGLVYVDASEWVAHHGEALRIAAERGELAIWDIARESELTV